MSSLVKKRRLKENSDNKNENNDSNRDCDIKKVVLYFVPGRIQQKRLEILKNCAKKNGYEVYEIPSVTVDFIITEFESKEQVFRFLNLNDETWHGRAEIVNIKWFTDSIKNKTPMPISKDYIIKSEEIVVNQQKLTAIADLDPYNCFACQRKSPFSHCNHILTEALDIVAKHAELRDSTVENDYPRALAFRKASAAIKSLPFQVKKVGQISKLKDVGKHSLNIIQEILEDGYSTEVQQIKNDEWFNSIQLFSTVFGVGPALANQWYNLGARTLTDVKQMKSFPGQNERVNYGLAFQQDLNTPVTIQEGNSVLEFIKSLVDEILPGTKLSLVGGFRRGKPAGHDVDILFTHPEPGKEIGLLREIHEILNAKGLILFGYMQRNTFTEAILKDDSATQNGALDNFEKCFYILKFPKDGVSWNCLENEMECQETKPDFEKLLEMAENSRDWRAIRVDLILTPIDQFAFALVGWTGNKQFNRSIRYYSKKKMNMKLTSHGLWSFEKQKSVLANSEKEIFSALNLNYLEPWERNA